MRPSEGGRHIQARVRRINPRVSAIGVVGEQCVIDDDRALVPRDVPLIGIGPRDLEFFAFLIVRHEAINILGEFMQRVAAR